MGVDTDAASLALPFAEESNEPEIEGSDSTLKSSQSCTVMVIGGKHGAGVYS